MEPAPTGVILITCVADLLSLSLDRHSIMYFADGVFNLNYAQAVNVSFNVALMCKESN